MAYIYKRQITRYLKKSEKKMFLLLQTQTFCKECSTGIDKAIKNSTNPIYNSGILKDWQAQKDDENQRALFNNREGRSLDT